MTDNGSSETCYTIRDTYGRIYSTTTSLLLEPTQEELQTYHHCLESDERAAAATTSHRDYTSELPSNLPS